MSEAPRPREGEVDCPAGLIISATKSDVPPPSNSRFIHQQGVIHTATSNGRVANAHYCVNDMGLYPVVTNWLQTDFGLDQFAFTSYSSLTAWASAIPDAPLDNVLTSQSFLQEVTEEARHKPGGSGSQLTILPEFRVSEHE
jgi:hypothetical protein